MRELAVSWPHAFLLLETETKGSPSWAAGEGEGEQERRERTRWPQGGVALLRCVRQSWWSGRIPGTGYRVPSTRYQVLGSQVGR